MNLGETIYRLRTGKNMSQGDLAEKLEVSRQSISKWENNSAVPDLDKIVKLSELFQVSLDELVKGESASPKEAENGFGSATGMNSDGRAEKGVLMRQMGSSFPPRKIAGTILLCMGFLVFFLLFVMGGGLAGLIFASPFLACGVVCFVCKKHVGLWCAWAVYICVDAYLRYATGITWSVVMLTHLWEPSMNYVRLGTGWAIFLVRILLITIAVVKLCREPGTRDRKARNRLIFQWAVVGAITVFDFVLHRTEIHSYVLSHIMSMHAVYSLVSTLLDWCRVGFFVAALAGTIRYIRSKRK